MELKIGQEVYTINAKTNEVDTWKYYGSIRTPKAILVRLVRGKRSCFLPARCVFTSKEAALKVAKG